MRSARRLAWQRADTTLLLAALAHPLMRLLGGSAPFQTTVAALAFGAAPAVLGLVPFGLVIAVPWVIGLSVIALGRMHTVGAGRASVAYTISLGIPVLLMMGVRVYVLEAFKIPCGSMAPTIRGGDHLFVNKSAYGVLSKNRFGISLSSAELDRDTPPDVREALARCLAERH